MILSLLFAVIFSLLIGIIVVKPLLAPDAREFFKRSVEGFADEEELRSIIKLRDSLTQKIKTGTCSDEKCNALTNVEAFDVLVSVGSRLHKAGLPFLPEKGAL